MLINVARSLGGFCLQPGTLGPKGHMQVIIPDLTENYGAQEDPEENAGKSYQLVPTNGKVVAG